MSLYYSVLYITDTRQRLGATILRTFHQPPPFSLVRLQCSPQVLSLAKEECTYSGM